MERTIPLNEYERLCKAFYERELDPEEFLNGRDSLADEVADSFSGVRADAVKFRSDAMTNLMRSYGNLSEDTLIPEKVDINVVHLPRYMPVTNHSHAFIECMYVAGASCEMIIGDERIEVREGDLFLLAPGVCHRTRAYCDDGIVIYIMVRRSTFQKSFIALLRGSDILADFFAHTIFGRSAQSYLLFHTVGDERLREWIFSMYDEAMSRDSYSARMLNTQFEWMCLHLLRNHIKRMDICGSLDDVKTAEILWYISDHVEDVSLSTMACEFGYSTGYLCRLIRKLTGYKFSDLVQRIRLDRACDLLENSGIGISKIAQDVGYCDTSNFYKAFKRYYGMTPASYRQQPSDAIKEGA
ncbi:MAG: AraC family transcriptional regulator [Clostridiales Family XIII bacterium]|jgi:AraC-like DNA-binding protein/quercetin dioxygenase-like cupin family protein|nr:AraC family transcriptional regulator [Clostridiales Family XIII bacterium]